MSRTIEVCGADSEQGVGFCILPPEHVEHTATDSGIVWHKAVDARGCSMSFATTPPDYVAPRLSDVAGLFVPEDFKHLCSVHWIRYIRYPDEIAEWWDETCQHCDHEKARPLFDELR